jgi:hypothetical protein
MRLHPKLNIPDEITRDTHSQSTTVCIKKVMHYSAFMLACLTLPV